MNEAASKTLLELALELGVRAQSLVDAMNDLGLDAESVETFVEPGIESLLIEEMVEKGVLPRRLLRGKGRRRLSGEPLADDDLVKAALGASESGYTESSIPRQLLLESSFAETPSFFQRWFGRKNTLAKSIQDQEYSSNELNALFAERTAASPSEAEEFEDDFFDELEEDVARSTLEEDRASDEIEDFVDGDLADLDVADLVDFDSDEFVEVEPVEDEPVEDEPVEAAAVEEDEIVDPNILQDLEDVDLDDIDVDEETLAEAELEELGFSTGTEEEDELFDVEEDIEQEVGIGEEDLEFDLDELDEGVEQPLDQEGAGKETKKRPFALESLLSRIQLSPKETWALMVGSSSILVLVLLITAYWWLFQSPRAQKGLLEQAHDRIAASRMEETWEGTARALSDAARKLERFINDYPDNPDVKSAFDLLCDVYYQLAVGYEEAGRPMESNEAYRRVALHYEQYLNYMDELAARAFADPTAPISQRFPDANEQMLAMSRIAVANRKLQRYDGATQYLTNLINRFGRTDEAYWAYEQLGEVFLEWAKAQKDEEDALMARAIANYERAILTLEGQTERNYAQLARMNAGLGDIHIRVYDSSLEDGKHDEANLRLQDAIGFYERAVEAARTAEDFDPVRQNSISKQLADLYLIRGRESGAKWTRFEEEARHFPEGIVYKQTLQAEAAQQQEITENFLNRANSLYDELLELDLPQDMREEIYYNKAEAYYTLRQYDDALEAGEALIERYANLNPAIETKIHYLLGHTGWEIGRQSGDFTIAKEYYRAALDIDPMFPPERSGEISHLAEIRLTNCYYIIDEKYEEALARYADAVGRYPDTGYTYLTLVWYGDALEQYGDKLMQEADEIDASPYTQAPHPEAEQLRQRAREHYENAVLIYNRAIQARDHSRYVDIHDEIYLMRVMFNRAHSAYKANELRQARDYLNEALRAYGTNRAAHQYIPPAIERLGDIHFRMGDYDSAVRYFRDYLTDAYPDPSGVVAMKLADSYLMRLSEDRAREWYRRIVRDFGLGPERGPGFVALRKIAESHNQEAGLLSGEEREAKKRSALEAYSELARRYPHPSNPNLPDDPASLRHIGNIHYELENYPQSIASYRAFMQSMPDYDRRGILQVRIAKAYLALGQHQEAIQELTNIDRGSLDNDEQYAEALLLLGQAHEARAKAYLDGDQPLLWEDSLKQAQLAYNRVAVANVPEKTQQAQRHRQAIDAVIQSRRELAQGN